MKIYRAMKKYRKKVFGVASAAMMAVVLGSGSAMAAAPWIDVSAIAVDTASVGTLGATVLTGLAMIWGLRKLIKTINRS